MKKILRSAAALALAGCMMSGNVLAATPTFTDVPSTYWGYTYITKAAEKGLVSGVGNGLYGVSSTLSAAQFATMVCNLLYKDAVTAYQTSNKSADWWGPYMAVAYSKNILKNTVAGDARTINGSWTADMVNAEINRYDMAQVMYNVAVAEGWDLPTSAQLQAAQAKIGDWNKVPSKYQTAVKTAYAKSFLSGMDDGTFSGESQMTRAQGAVVLCKLLDAKTTADANVVATPKFTNTTKLVNGKEATEENVVAALKTLKTDYPSSYIWNMKSKYKSVVLGSGEGSDAFAFMLADKVFGNFGLSAGTADTIKPGDIVYLTDSNRHVVVTDVYDKEFDYVSCDSVGKITWGNTLKKTDLSSKDVIYTRYEGEGDYSGESEKTLTNGKKATESNVKALIKTFLKGKDSGEYAVGDEWKNKTYTSKPFYSKSVTGDRAFAYYLSDYVFGDDADVAEVDDFDDLRVGDVIYWDDEEEYLVISVIDDDELTCVGVYKDKVYEQDLLVDELDDDDVAYTRYPDATDDDDDDDADTSAAEGELTNGKSVTAANVKSLIKTFRSDSKSGYDDGDTWKDTKKYTSTEFYKKAVYGSRAFAYYLSDYVFGDDAAVYEVDDFDDLRTGDVIYWDDLDEYLVITNIDDDEIDYIGVDELEEEVYSDTLYLDELDTSDSAWTRYPEEEEKNTLSNGKEATETNVKALLTKFYSDEYEENDKYDDSHKSKYFSTSRVYDDQAFAYYLSDYIFGSLSVKEVEDFEDLRVGDVVYINDTYSDEYVVITAVDGDDLSYIGVWDEVVYTDEIDVDDLGTDDEAWTRYVDEVEEDTLANGKSVTDRNVRNLISEFTSTYKDGDEWASNKTYSPKKAGFGTRVVAGDKAFAYFFSDSVFGSLSVTKITDMDDLRRGDVLYYNDWDEWLVVTEISSDELTVVGIDPEEYEIYTTLLDVDDLDEDSYAYTRYPD